MHDKVTRIVGRVVGAAWIIGGVYGIICVVLFPVDRLLNFCASLVMLVGGTYFAFARNPIGTRHKDRDAICD